jgi:hypothetical protein
MVNANSMQRFLLGCFALAFFLAAALLHGFASPQIASVVAGPALRVGLMLGILWLALPSLARVRDRISIWTMLISAAILFMVILRPKLIVFVIPVLLGFWLLSFKWFPQATGMGKRHPPQEK